MKEQACVAGRPTDDIYCDPFCIFFLSRGSTHAMSQREAGGICGAEDSFGHLLGCYSLEQDVRAGPDTVDFLVKMAWQTVPLKPGVVTPRCEG